MSRILIGASALAELRRVRPLARRRAVVARISSLDLPRRRDRLCDAGRHRLTVGDVKVLYRLRSDGTVVLVGLSSALLP